MSISKSSSIVRTNTAVFVRILPELTTNLEYFKILLDEKTIYVRSWQDFAKGRTPAVPNYFLFNTNGIIYNMPQQRIFESVVDDSVFERLIYGNNALVLSYGQTGSGKTLTTAGLESTFEDRGILPRILERLFAEKQKHMEKLKISIKMKYIETNRNYMKDLLSNNDVIYDMNNYQNIQPVKVKSLNDGLRMIFMAEARKSMRQSQYYKSNLGNTIVTFTIFTKGHNTPLSEGTLHVIDLAGVDTIGNSSCAHKNGYEVGNGNLAKSQIEQLVLVINDNFSKAAELKQRLCIIIHYLHTSINANSIIRVVAHVRVQREDLKICASMLRLGCSFKGMIPKKLSRFLETSIDVQYQVVADELKALKKEIDLNAMLCDEDMTYNLSDERLNYIKQLALEYLDGDKSELLLLSTTDTVIVMKVIKNIYKKLMSEIKSVKSKATILEARTSRTTKLSDSNMTSTRSSRRLQSVASSSNEDARMKRHSRKQAAAGSVYSSSKIKLQLKSKGNVNKDGLSEHSLRSKSAVSKHSVRRSTTGKRSSADASRESQIASSSVLQLPEEVPSFATAWSKFKTDESAKYSDIHLNQKMFDSELETLTRNYNKEVLVLEELINIAARRRNDLSHAILIKDIDTTPQALMELHDFKNNCTVLSKEADRNVVDQKEKLLTLQAEMQLNMDYRFRLQKEVNKIYDDYCLRRFKVLIPFLGDRTSKVGEFEIARVDFPNFNEVAELTINDKSVMMDALQDEPQPEDNGGQQSLDYECDDIARFEKMKEFMKREANRVYKRKVQNQKWIMSFYKGPSCAAKLNF